MPPGAIPPGQVPVTTFKIVHFPIGEDFETPDGYFIKDVIQAVEKDKTVFYCVLGKSPDQNKLDVLKPGVMDKDTERKLRKGERLGAKR